MDFYLLLLQTFLLLSVVLINFVNHYRLKQEKKNLEYKFQEIRDLLIENVQSKLNNHIQHIESGFQEHFTNIGREHEETLARLDNDLTERFNQMIERFSAKLDQELYLNEQKIAEWQDFVETLSTTEEKIEALESSINKYPYSKELVNKYLQVTGQLLSEENPVVMKRTLERMNKVSRSFLDNCDVRDYNEAIYLYNDILQRGKDFVESSYEKRVEKVKQQLNTLENKVSELEKHDINLKSESNIVSELEEIENGLDKQLIQKVSVLNGEYQRLSKRIMDVLSQNNHEEKVRIYNLDALDSLRSLHQKFRLNSKDYKSGRITEIADILGAWDTSYFTPQTNVYYQFVYKEIFDNLSQDEKPKLTERVLKTEKKRVS